MNHHGSVNWAMTGLILYFALAIELGLRGGVTIAQSAAPSLMFAVTACFAVYAGLWSLLWIAFLAGLLVDLMTPIAPVGMGEAVVVIGPRALGFMVGAYLVYLLRGFLFVRNAITITVVGMMGAAAAGVVSLAILQVRSITDPDILLARPSLISAMLSAVYSGVPMLLLGLVWRRLLPWLGLSDPSRSRYDRVVVDR